MRHLLPPGMPGGVPLTPVVCCQRQTVLQHQALGGLPAAGFQQGTDFIAGFLLPSRRGSQPGAPPAQGPASPGALHAQQPSLACAGLPRLMRLRWP